MSKVALITGGVSGMGLAVARSLALKGWKLSLLDVNAAQGAAVAKELDATFYKTDVTSYDQLGSAFSGSWKKHGRLDFVFANAGIFEPGAFYDRVTEDSNLVPTIKPYLKVMAINTDAMITTSYLAQHFMRKNSTSGGSLVINASCGGIYPVPFSPIYAASKHAAVGFTRSIAKHMLKDGIRVNATCPGTVVTGLIPAEMWKEMNQEAFVPIEKVVEVVNMFIEDQTLSGKTVELVQDRYYFRDPPEYVDKYMKATMEGMDFEP